VPLFSAPNGDDLAALAELVQAGSVRPVLGDVLDLSDTAEAVRRIETGHGTGRTVVTT
jgi:NADPH:quinone reductase-like Zn-dependent oxidoreductase